MAEAGTARVTAALAGAGVAGIRWRAAPLRRRTVNDVYLVELADGTRLVVKLPPGSGTPVLRYERQGILGTEALYSRLAGECGDVTVPAVMAVTAPTRPAGTS